MRERNGDDATPNELDAPMSRRAKRLADEEKKIAEIARQREMERLHELTNRRADEIRREREAAQSREEERNRHLENIRQSQPIPVLSPDMLADAPPRAAAARRSSAVQEGTPSYAERGHVGAQRKLRAERKEAAKKKPAQTPRVKPAYLKIKGIGRSLVVLIVTGLTVAMALPATGFDQIAVPDDSKSGKPAQSVDAAAGGDQAEVIALGDFAVTSYASVLAEKYGSSGSWSYSVTNAGKIRWPFPAVVPISSGFGGRVAPCFGCSSFHEGMDFDPGEGTPFFAVADGVVTEVHNDAWGLGKWVLIHHEVGNLTFDSLYAHMIENSTGVKVGDHVAAGDYVGKVGNTGTSTGPHLHFEIHINGKPVDPFEWLKKHTQGN
jgi:murein DD-endopeptidase MepM/ murein hydrolase activator NlpD